MTGKDVIISFASRARFSSRCSAVIVSLGDLLLVTLSHISHAGGGLLNYGANSRDAHLDCSAHSILMLLDEEGRDILVLLVFADQKTAQLNGVVVVVATELATQ